MQMSCHVFVLPYIRGFAIMCNYQSTIDIDIDVGSLCLLLRPSNPLYLFRNGLNIQQSV